MYLGVDKSINDILERAENEKAEILQKISFLLDERFPQILNDNLKQIESYDRIARKLNIGYEPNMDMQKFINAYINKLLHVKEELEALDLDEETILKESSIENAQEIVGLVDLAIEEAKSNFIISTEKEIGENYDKKIQVGQQIQELELERMYLKGKLDVTKRKKEKSILEEKMSKIDESIRRLQEESKDLEYKESNLKAPSVAEENEKNAEHTEGINNESNEPKVEELNR